MVRALGFKWKVKRGVIMTVITSKKFLEAAKIEQNELISCMTAHKALIATAALTNVSIEETLAAISAELVNIDKERISIGATANFIELVIELCLETYRKIPGRGCAVRLNPSTVPELVRHDLLVQSGFGFVLDSDVAEGGVLMYEGDETTSVVDIIEAVREKIVSIHNPAFIHGDSDVKH